MMHWNIAIDHNHDRHSQIFLSFHIDIIPLYLIEIHHGEVIQKSHQKETVGILSVSGNHIEESQMRPESARLWRLLLATSTWVIPTKAETCESGSTEDQKEGPEKEGRTKEEEGGEKEEGGQEEEGRQKEEGIEEEEEIIQEEEEGGEKTTAVEKEEIIAESQSQRCRTQQDLETNWHE